MTQPPTAGILETCLYVEEVGVARAFYERVFGLTAMVADERICAFDVGPKSVLILFKRGGTPKRIPIGDGFIPPHDGGGHQHFAFAVAAEDFDAWKVHLSAEGVAIESEVAWPQGGRSLYFRDPDGLVVELATPGLWRNY